VAAIERSRRRGRHATGPRTGFGTLGWPSSCASASATYPCVSRV